MLKAIFYLANTGNSLNFIRTYGVKHIFLGHGDSDKSASMNRLFKIYDEIFVAGQAHIDRFLNADFDTTGIKFKIIGRPNKPYTSLIKSKEKISKIIYLPTWEGNVKESEYSSLDICLEILKKIRKTTNLHIIVKLHPSTGLFDKSKLNIENKIKKLNIKNITIKDKKENISKLLFTDAIYICDTSSVITEALTTGSPIITFIPKTKIIRSVSSKLSLTSFTYPYSNTDELSVHIKNIINLEDILKEKRINALDYFIKTDRTNNNQFLKELDKLAAITKEI